MQRPLKPSPGRPAHTNFSQFVDTLPESPRLLGLTHITSSYLLRDIVSTGEIAAPDQCPVLRELVTYFFYGRAAFRGRTDTNPTDVLSAFPVVIVLDPSRTPKPRYVFGFDSGAFVGGHMEQYFNPHMPLFDLLLSPDVRSAGRLITALFGTNEEYLRNKPTGQNFSPPPSNFEAECYKKMVMGGGQGATRLDDRCSTPEILFGDAINISQCVKAAVLPDSLASDPQIGGILANNNIEIHDYMWRSGSRPIEYHSLMHEIVKNIYRDAGWL